MKTIKLEDREIELIKSSLLKSIGGLAMSFEGVDDKALKALTAPHEKIINKLNSITEPKGEYHHRKVK